MEGASFETGGTVLCPWATDAMASSTNKTTVFISYARRVSRALSMAKAGLVQANGNQDNSVFLLGTPGVKCGQHPRTMCCPNTDTRDRELGHPKFDRKDRIIVLLIYNTHGSVRASVKPRLTWFRLQRRVLLTHQSRIESCPGRFTETRIVAVKRSVTPRNSSSLWRCGARPLATSTRATYLALRHIVISCHPASVGLSLTRQSRPREDQELHWKQDGISASPLEFCAGSTEEPSMPPSRYQGSLTGSHNSLTGLVP